MKFLFGISQWMAAILVSLLILTMSIGFFAYNKSVYMDLYAKNAVLEATGMDEENLSAVTDTLIGYMKDDLESLDTQATIRGEERDVFGAREKAHMVDVKNLFQLNDALRGMFLGLILFLIGISMWRGYYALIYSIAVKQFVVTILFSGSLMVVSMTNFTAAFIKFHHMLFTNDLWLLDPKTDTLIQMLPEPFFRSMALMMFGTWFGGSMLVGIIGWALRQRMA